MNETYLTTYLSSYINIQMNTIDLINNYLPVHGKISCSHAASHMYFSYTRSVFKLDAIAMVTYLRVPISCI